MAIHIYSKAKSKHSEKPKPKAAHSEKPAVKSTYTTKRDGTPVFMPEETVKVTAPVKSEKPTPERPKSVFIPEQMPEPEPAPKLKAV